MHLSRLERDSSLAVDPEQALRLAVSHLDIENPLHWTLDMVFSPPAFDSGCW